MRLIFKINWYWILILPLTIQIEMLYGQASPLDRYIREAFASSPMLYQSDLEVEKSKLVKDFARSYYFPTASIQMGYQTAAGGRNIDLPVGDMLNGVYSTLNQITGTSSFPTIDNQHINFLPNNFYDFKIRTSVPIFNPEVSHQIRLADKQTESTSLNLRLRKRQLVAQIKEAYFNYLMTTGVVKIYREALDLGAEGRRINQRLLEHGKGLPAYLLRSDAEIASIKDEIFQAETASKNARIWFNFLLNKPDSTAIDTLFDESTMLSYCKSLLLTTPGDQREEMKMLVNASSSLEEVVKLNKSAALPRLNAIIDLGSQAEQWQFNSQSRYFLLGLQLEVPLFSANRVKNKVEQAKIDLNRNESVTRHARDQFDLAGEIALNNLRSALEGIEARKKQVEAASTYRRLIEKGYAEGVSTFIETVDARNQWKTSQLAYKIQLYKVFQAGVNVEKELALFNIDQY